MIDEWYGCRSCSKSVMCLDRHDHIKQRVMKATDNCNEREYRNNVMMRSTFR